MGADEVYIVYRRGDGGASGSSGGESTTPKEEGIVFKSLTNPVEVLG